MKRKQRKFKIIRKSRYDINRIETLKDLITKDIKIYSYMEIIWNTNGILTTLIGKGLIYYSDKKNDDGHVSFMVVRPDGDQELASGCFIAVDDCGFFRHFHFDELSE